MKPIASNDLKAILIGMDTHQGETGKNNEDWSDFSAYTLSEKDGTEVFVGIVADGIGGHQAGERASRMAVDVVKGYLLTVTTPNFQRHLKEAYLTANAEVVREGQQDARFRGMGTTMTSAVIMNQRLYLANVGDSRAYLMRNDQLFQLTIDHTWAQEAIDAGRLTPQQARSHPNRNVIKRYMGIQSEMEVDLRLRLPGNGAAPPSEQNQGLLLEPGDTVLLCSDGLSDMVSDPDILDTMVKNRTPQRAAEELVLLARKRGGYDNITVVLMQIPGKKPSAVAHRGGSAGLWVGIAALAVLGLAAVGGVWAFTAGPFKSKATPTVLATAAAVTSAPSMETTALAVSPTFTTTPLATETPPPSRTPSPTAAPTDEGGELATPTRLPTFTLTNTPTPRPTSTRTRTPVPTVQITDTPDSGSPPTASPPEPKTAEPPPRP